MSRPASAERTAARHICPRCLTKYDGDAQVCPDDGRTLLTVGPGDDPAVLSVIDDRYTLLECIGRGGMGVVYRALQHSMQREVAIKLLARDRARSGSEAASRFRREGLATSRLHHPNVITVFEAAVSADGESFLVMELLRGESLRALIARERLAPRRCALIMLQVLGALEAAHDAGIIHRDLKPENIFMVATKRASADFVKVLDFGIAKPTGGDFASWSTEQPVGFGTPGYMSPEQLLGEPIDGRSDLYAAGIVLIELLTGELPFKDTSPVRLMLNKLNHDLAVDTIDVAAPLVSLLGDLVSRRLDRRPASAGEVMARLEAVRDELPTVPPVVAPRRASAEAHAGTDGGRAEPRVIAETESLDAVPLRSGPARNVKDAPAPELLGDGHATHPPPMFDDALPAASIVDEADPSPVRATLPPAPRSRSRWAIPAGAVAASAAAIMSYAAAVREPAPTAASPLTVDRAATAPPASPSLPPLPAPSPASPVPASSAPVPRPSTPPAPPLVHHDTGLLAHDVEGPVPAVRRGAVLVLPKPAPSPVRRPSRVVDVPSKADPTPPGSVLPNIVE